MQRRFQQIDVFTDVPYRGNPLAVVVDGDGLTDEDMQQFASWMNLSETTFIVPPNDPDADYRVRIFTTTMELPFAGHPTLGTCKVWLDHLGEPKTLDRIVQECGVGLVPIRRDDRRLAFAAPPLIRSGPVDDGIRRRIEVVVGGPVEDAAWVDNGPGWVAARLASTEQLLALEPDFGRARDIALGLVAPAPDDADHDIDVRAFFPGPGAMLEDPVTGSLNASLAQWLMGADSELTAYVACQGTALGRDGRVYVERDEDGTIWIGGHVTTCITGGVEL